jgi:hypothetical protein
LVDGIEAGARAKAKGALLGLLRSAGGPRLRRPWRPVTAKGLSRACAGIGGLALALVVLAAGGVFFVLAAGPISLESLNPSVEHSLEDRLGEGYHVTIGRTSLARGPSGLALGFGAIQIRDREGRTVVSAPGGRIGLDVLALLGLQVKVRRLTLDGLDVKLRVRPDGALSMAAGGASDAAPIEWRAPAPSNGTPSDPGVLAIAMIEALAGSRQSLDHMSLLHGHLDVDNEALGKKSVYEDFAVSFDKTGPVAVVEASALGPAGRWSVSARADDGAERGLRLEARDFGLDDFLLLDPARPPIKSEMPISFKIDARLTPGGAIQSLDGGFTLGAGYVKLDDPDDEPYLIDEATGRLGWDAKASRFRADGIEILAGASHVKADGWLAPPSAAEPAWSGRLHSGDILFAAERPGELPVPIDDASLEARYWPAEARFAVDRFTVHGPHIQGQMTVDSRAVPGGATLKLNVQLGPSAAADVIRIWPTFINGEARDWCAQHVRAGELESGSVKIDWDAAAFDDAMHKRPVPPDSLRGDFTMRDAAVDLLPGVPALTGLDAEGFITGRVFSVSAKHGAMEFSQGRRMQASDISFKIPDTRPLPVVASQASAHVTGTADALADLLSRDAIKRFAGFSVDPANVKGQFQGQLIVDLGLGKNVPPEDQRFRVDGTLSGLQLDKYVANERFEQGTLDVMADGGNLKITGQGQINGLPTKVDLAKGAADEGALTLNMTVDDAARARLGLNVVTPMIGPMNVRLKSALGKPGAGSDVEVDLAKVELDTPEGAVMKPAGRPGKATFTMKTGPDGYAVGSLAIDAGSLLARGAVQLGLDGALQSAKLSQLRLLPGDDLRADIQGGMPLKAVVRGASFDARGLVRALFGANAGSGGVKDVDIDARIGRVIGSNKQDIAQFEIVASRRGGVMRTIQAKGQLGYGALSARKDESGLLAVKAADAGALGKFLDFYNKMEGGVLDLTLQDAPEGSRGAAVIKRFTLRDEPAFKRLAAEGTPTNRGLPTGAAPIDPDAVKFDRMTANFTRSPGRLDLRDALIFNPEIGLTATGFIDYAKDKVDVSGTFVPAYGVNSLITNVPVVGLLLGGGRNEGIFAVNYRITGPASGPTLTINPLSGMTPGILRKIFGAVDGTSQPAIEPGPRSDQ